LQVYQMELLCVKCIILGYFHIANSGRGRSNVGAGPNGVSQEIAMVKSYAGNGVLQQASVVRSPTEGQKTTSIGTVSVGSGTQFPVCEPRAGGPPINKVS